MDIEKLISKENKHKKYEPIDETFVWQKITDIQFSVKLPDSNIIFINKKVDKWVMSAIINKQRYEAIRDTIRDAFIVADRLIYKERQDWWTKINPHIILEEWQGDLTL